MKTILNLFFSKDKDQRYKLAYIPYDFFAAATLSTVVLPLSMAYSRVAGLNPVHGLYSKYMVKNI
jgi:MFS superfamily sulfate permease-like transporter